MSEQFSLPVTENLIDQFATLFPCATGRDIKGRTKLVAEFCQQKQLQPDLEVFKHCSVFRGPELAKV